MAKLAPYELFLQSDIEEKFKFIFDVRVTSDGIFHFEIPDELKDTVENAISNQKVDYDLLVIIGILKNGKYAISHKEYNACKKIVDIAGQEYVKSESKEEIVICYGIDSKVTYFKSNDGEIFSNGQLAEGRWLGKVNDCGVNQVSFYSVGLVAICFLKTTYNRSSGSKVKYSKYDGDIIGEYGNRLNNFVGIKLNDCSLRNLSELPYTEEAAKFFYEMMIGICRLADRMGEFFGDKEKIIQAIETGAIKLLN